MESWNTQIWQAFRDNTLTRAYRDVLLCLPKFRGRDGLIFPSHETIAARAKCCVRTVQRALNAAATLGLVRWWQRRKRVGPATERTSNLYELLAENPAKPATGQRVRVASQENLFFLTAAPDRADSLIALARVAAERTRLLPKRSAYSGSGIPSR